LSQAGIGIDEVDHFAVGISENAISGSAAVDNIGAIVGGPMSRQSALVEHHLAHAYCAYSERTLILKCHSLWHFRHTRATQTHSAREIEDIRQIV
jgi:hypothetical protein